MNCTLTSGIFQMDEIGIDGDAVGGNGFRKWNARNIPIHDDEGGEIVEILTGIFEEFHSNHLRCHHLIITNKIGLFQIIRKGLRKRELGSVDMRWPLISNQNILRRSRVNISYEPSHTHTDF